MQQMRSFPDLLWDYAASAEDMISSKNGGPVVSMPSIGMDITRRFGRQKDAIRYLSSLMLLGTDWEISFFCLKYNDSSSLGGIL